MGRFTLPRRDSGDEVHDEMVFLTYPQYQLIRAHAPQTVRDMPRNRIGRTSILG